MLDYEIKTVEGRKVAYFKELNYYTEVNIDKVDGEYIEIPNVLNTDVPKYRYDTYYTLARYSFAGRIKDAVLSIMNGDGDAICRSRNHIWVNYYLDREVGEQYRTMTINGFKDTKFAYAIEYYNGMLSTETKYFETYADAEKHVGELI